jgi:energy-converting hydrogenase B subunit N
MATEDDSYAEFMGKGKSREKTFETEIPIGFNHSALLEPYRTRYFVEDEIIRDCEIEVDPAHRGIERILQGMPIEKANIITERICGICSHSHLFNSVRTAEIGLGIEPPEAAVAVRVLGQELERLHSHLIFIAHACEVLGHETFAYRTFLMREPVMQLLYMISGNRVHYSIPVLGGIRPRTQIPTWKGEKILAAMDELEVELKKFIDRVLSDIMVMARLEGVGMCDRKTAKKYHANGPTARASGIDFDHRSHMHEYEDFDWEMVVLDEGDNAARIKTRALECLVSLDISRQCVERASGDSDVLNRDWETGRMPMQHGYTEVPRGELYHSYALNDQGKIQHYIVRTPTMTNLATMEVACIGDQLTDGVVTLASCDPCLTCCNRFIVVDQSGKERLMTPGDLRGG